MKGSEFLRFFIPIIDVLKTLGGSGTASETTDLVIEKLNISEKEQQETLKNGSSRIKNQVHWARLYLVKAGLLDSSQRGVWSLTEKGLKASLNDADVLKISKEVANKHLGAKKSKNKEDRSEIEEIKEDETEPEGYKSELLNILQSLPPDGFERICQRLLREAGFQQVNVTGRSSDGGIDGHGILEVNPFVSFKVLFQCKRYQGSVSPSQVRDFRGAMQGRADKGIILTTGIFTTEAKKESVRDGVPPIELVDGEKLIEMFENLELGLKPKQSFEIDPGFFKDFR